MRVNAANGIEASAHPWRNPPRVQIRIGVHRFTATPEEAIEFGNQLIAAAKAARSDD